MNIRSTVAAGMAGAFLLGMVGLEVGGCSVITGGDVGLGIGQACKETSDCQGSECVSGLCTLKCEANSECPDGSTCSAVSHSCSSPSVAIGDACKDAAECESGTCSEGLCTKTCTSNPDCPSPSICAGNLCSIPMHASFLYVGITEDQGWSFIHDEARKAAMQRLPWLTTDFEVSLYTDDLVRDAGNAAIAKGANVIIHTAQGSATVMKDLAQQNPDVKFLQLFDTVVTPPNLGAYWLRIHQGWYVAGAVAARKSTTNRIGFIGGYVSPQGVIRANGFIRGARSVNPDIKVEVRWLGFWFDPDPMHDLFDEKLEVQLANQVIDSGCDVIIANLDNELSYEAIENAKVKDAKNVWSIATNNVASCAKYPATCLGVVGLNWTSIYIDELDAMHKKTWEPGYVHANMTNDPKESPVSFIPNTANVSVDTSLAVGTLLGNLVADENLALKGPYKSTGQRNPVDVADGEVIGDEELLHMCWFAEGAVERSDPMDPMSADIPAIVPDGTRTLLTGDKPDCRKNQ